MSSINTFDTKSLPEQVQCRSGIGLREPHFEEILKNKPNISWLEAHSENYFDFGGVPHQYLKDIAQHYPISLHCIGLSDIVTSKEVLASFISENLPGYKVSPVPGDGLCMVHSFSSALTTLHGRTFTNDDVICKLRGELLSNFDFYKVFCRGVSILSELEKFLQSPLAYYNAEVFDLFMHASGNAFEVNIIIFCADTKKAWIVDFSKNDKKYNTTLHFARGLSVHVDPVLPIDRHSTFPEHKEEELTITRVVKGSKPSASDVFKKGPKDQGNFQRF